MSKTKENVPLKSQRRASGSNIGLSATQESDEFFTDSILESDATRTSKIPTPISYKVIQTKSRRSRKPTKLAGGKSQGTGNILVAEHQSISRESGLGPAIKIRSSKSPSPLRTRIAATPPQTKIRTDLASPGIDIQSPPPEGFIDVYKQIADEEDLAATERESSSSDDSIPEQSNEGRLAVASHHRHPISKSRSRHTLSPSSRSSTPTRFTRNSQNRDDLVEDSRNHVSENTDMSFLNQLTDQQLAEKLTPHMSESAKDRAKLREVWSNQKPVAFTKVGRLKSNVAREAEEYPFPGPQPRAFGKVGRPAVYESEDGSSNRPESRHSDGSLENYAVRLGTWDEAGQPLKELPTNARVERQFHFSRRHGFPQGRPALTEQNLEQQNRSGNRYIHLGQSGPTSHHSDPISGNMHSSQIRQRVNDEYSVHAQKVKSKVMDLINSELLPASQRRTENTESMVDWAAAAADIPLPSRESSALSAPKDLTAAEPVKKISPERSRRWDIDLTGQSFQVSESPPVRNKPRKSDPSLGKEIENLTKRAVTTSRLGEIREKHSQEQLGTYAASSAIQSSSDKRLEAPKSEQSETADGVGEPVPNTPVVIYRSNSSSSSDKRPTTAEHSAQGSSDEYLQRFARAMSNTPKSSPATTVVSREADGVQNPSSKVIKQPTVDIRDLKRDGIPAIPPTTVAETPKVVGAWTDTLLPDTIKTVRPPTAQAKYTQTPHVSAGGWIETPLPIGAKKIEMTPILEEIPEELINGIARGKLAQHPEAIAGSDAKLVTSGSGNDPPKVGLAGILDRAKQRLISQDITTAARENDTLNLGNETIESLQDLLTLDADEFTVLSKVFNEDDEGPGVEGAQAEAVILERIGTKLDRLRSNIHEARKGISQLEHKVSQPDIIHDHQAHSTSAVCTACNQSLYTFQGGSLPVAPLHVTIPIPLLFHLQPKSSSAKTGPLGFRLPQPTPLGYFTLAVWLWYIIECTLSEIYSHPTHAEYYTWPSPHHLEPEFPWVLPTMLSRWFQLENLISATGLVFGWIYILFSAVTKTIGMWTGWTDGFIDSNSLRKAVNSVTSTAAASVGFETDMSMMNDEFL